MGGRDWIKTGTGEGEGGKGGEVLCRHFLTGGVACDVKPKWWLEGHQPSKKKKIGRAACYRHKGRIVSATLGTSEAAEISSQGQVPPNTTANRLLPAAECHEGQARQPPFRTKLRNPGASQRCGLGHVPWLDVSCEMAQPKNRLVHRHLVRCRQFALGQGRPLSRAIEYLVMNSECMAVYKTRASSTDHTEYHSVKCNTPYRLNKHDMFVTLQSARVRVGGSRGRCPSVVPNLPTLPR
jgi:hypothetical protein